MLLNLQKRPPVYKDYILLTPKLVFMHVQGYCICYGFYERLYLPELIEH